MSKFVKKSFIAIFTLILLASCDQPSVVDKSKPDEPTNKIANDGKFVEAELVQSKLPQSNLVDTESVEFSLLKDEPFIRIESDESCEAPVVMEFFAYQCPHCYTLETEAKKWKDSNKGKVSFVAIPTHLGKEEFGSFLIVHHAANFLGLLDKATPALFDRIHNQKKGFTSPDDAIAFLVSLGAKQEEAKTAIESDEKIKVAIDESFRLLSKYKIAAVPTIIVNHKYQFDITKAGGYDKVFAVVEQTLKLDSDCSSK
ncbi:MAG: thiol:disulfide interchange protein DsbA [Polaribacter sp.]|jgi:thiol:disulfide interchange protein DsbA